MGDYAFPKFATIYNRFKFMEASLFFYHKKIKVSFRMVTIFFRSMRCYNIRNLERLGILRICRKSISLVLFHLVIYFSKSIFSCLPPTCP